MHSLIKDPSVNSSNIKVQRDSFVDTDTTHNDTIQGAISMAIPVGYGFNVDAITLMLSLDLNRFFFCAGICLI